MRALLIVGTAAVAVGLLAGCGQPAEQEPAGQKVTESPSGTAVEESGAPPEPPSVVVEPTPPGAKPQDPVPGEPPVTIGPDGPVVPAGVTEVPATQVDAKGLPAYFEYGNRVWSFNDGFALQLFAAANSGCAGVEALVAEQTADSVRIVVRPMDSPQGGRPDDSVCTTVMTPRPVVVTLDTPLRDRTVHLAAG